MSRPRAVGSNSPVEHLIALELRTALAALTRAHRLARSQHRGATDPAARMAARSYERGLRRALASCGAITGGGHAAPYEEPSAPEGND